MACYGAKFAYGASFLGLGAGVAAVAAAAPTVVGEVAGFSALLAACAAHIGAAIALAECLEQVGRAQDAAELRREVNELEQEMQRIRQMIE